MSRRSVIDIAALGEDLGRIAVEGADDSDGRIRGVYAAVMGLYTGAGITSAEAAVLAQYLRDAAEDASDDEMAETTTPTRSLN